MTAPPVLCTADLDAESALLLPARETMSLDFTIDVAPVVGVNLAFAINAATIGSTANAAALQHLASMR